MLITHHSQDELLKIVDSVFKTLKSSSPPLAYVTFATLIGKNVPFSALKRISMAINIAYMTVWSLSTKYLKVASH